LNAPPITNPRVTFADSVTQHDQGVIGGGQFGDNYQINPRCALGFEVGKGKAPIIGKGKGKAPVVPLTAINPPPSFPGGPGGGAGPLRATTGTTFPVGGNGAPPGTRLIDMPAIPLPPGSGMPPSRETQYVMDEVVFQIRDDISVQQVAQVAARFGLTVASATPIRILGRTIYTFRIPDGRSVREIIRQIEASGLGAVQPNYVYKLQAAGATPLPGAGPLPQYISAKLQLDAIHRLSRGDGVIVAMIDSRIDATHPDLEGVVTDRLDVGCGAAPDAHGTGMTGAVAAIGQRPGPPARAVSTVAVSVARP